MNLITALMSYSNPTLEYNCTNNPSSLPCSLGWEAKSLIDAGFFAYYNGEVGSCAIAYLKMNIHIIAISRSDGSEDCTFFKTTSRGYIIFVSD